MRAPLLLLGGIILLSVAVARALSCVCSPLECDDLTEEDCPGGLTWDPCRCCKVCARVEGEPCGGLFGFSGSCAVGLQCVIKNLLHHTREVDEGVCEKIPGRWRRHCPHRSKMSGPGCNVVGDGSSTENGNAVGTGKCVCGPSVPWCLGEPRPYVYKTVHECNLNLAAKIVFDDLFYSEDTADDDVDVEGPVQDVVGECPEDSVPNESGGCKCRAVCPPAKCPSGQRPIQQPKPTSPKTPGNCCPRYDCVSPDAPGSSTVFCPEDSIPTGEGQCECVPTCPPATCRLGQRPFEVRAAVLKTPGKCCPLYVCKPSESVSWADADEGKEPGNCIQEGVSRKPGEKWQESDCVHCVCEEGGTVSCQTTMCKSCENPSPRIRGECCPHCTTPTNSSIFEPTPDSCRLVECNLRCEEGYANDEKNCPICECARRTDEDDEDDNEDDHDTPASPPEELDKSCPDPVHCEENCDLLKDEKGCFAVCDCSRISDGRSNESVARKICPEVKCDLHCERGLVMDENDCTFCECKPPHDGCPGLDGCKKRCTFGYKTNKRGCPVCRCRASCTDHSNETHPEGSIWHPNSCTTCTCEPGGRLNCKETICSVACCNPLPPKPGTCCPVCPISTTKESGSGSGHHTRGWGTVPITLIVVLALLCLLLIVHIVRNRFRGRLSTSEGSYSSCPPQYYKCVPAYDTPVHRNEKIVPV